MKRSSGVLLPVSALPSEFGIGGFSQDAENFILSILDMGFHWWQILPLNPIGYGNSPYSGLSSMAGSYLYIDPIRMVEEGFLAEEAIEQLKYKGEPYVVDYEFASNAKRTAIQIAYSTLTPERKKEVEEFAKKEKYWLDDYAMYMSIYEQNHLPFQEWEKDLRDKTSSAIASIAKNNKDRIGYYQFEQYLFFRQWNRIKKFANSFGIGIIGDMPIYVCRDSVDVWANRNYFLLDKEGNPKATAGLPPDYFSKTGHDWGNPIYDYKAMEKNNYQYWVNKIGHALEMYDSLRLDHFRGYFEYWSIPTGKQASEGKWQIGPGTKLFDIIKKEFKDSEFIAEDLGITDEKIKKEMNKVGFLGMRVMLFAFYDEETQHLPHNYDTNVVAYTGTHDNNTVLGWLFKEKDNVRDYALHYCGIDELGWAHGGSHCSSTRGFITTLIRSSARLAIVPIQDLCGFGEDCRINTPGKCEGNWTFRLTYSALNGLDNSYYKSINKLYGRDRGYKG